MTRQPPLGAAARPIFRKTTSAAIATTALLALAGVAPALAAPLRASPFRGALVPAGAVAGDADATALELNPGQLPLAERGSAALVIDHWSADTPRAGRGTALLYSTPLFLGLSLGAGFHWLRPTLPGEPSSYRKFQLGTGLRLGRSLGLGVVWDHLFGASYGGADSLSLGLGARLHPIVAVGLAVRDVTRPRVDPLGERLPRAWEAELALRPLGTDRIEAAVAVRILQGADTPVRPRARLSVRVRQGLSLFAELDSARDQRDGLGPDGALRVSRVDWSLLGGLNLELGRHGVTVAGAASWGENPGGDGAEGGGSLVLRTYPGRRLPLLPLRQVQRVKLEGLGRDLAFTEMVVRLRRLADEPSAGAVLLEIDDLGLGLGRLEELRDLVQAIRQRKPVFAQLATASMREYFLASAADRIVIHPAGSINLSGLAQTVTFYKGALDRLGVQVELVRIAEFKGAMEPFIMTEQSEPVRQNRNALLDEQYSRLIEGIAAGRAGHGLPAEALTGLVERALFAAGEAFQSHLVDGVAEDRDVDRFVRESLGRGWAVRSDQPGALERRRWAPSRVGVVLVDGAIVDAPAGGLPFSSGTVAVADRIVDALDDLRKDGSVRAVVLRVNSPGGSAFASDRIARAVGRVRAAGKPVIASMGDVAASGGYYVAAPADEVLASATTTTGSIGIFGYKVDLQGLLGKLGLSAETYRRGPHADLYTPYRPWSEDEQRIVRDHIRKMYYLFLDTVAAGRKSRGITVERADELGRGRIYSGRQAQAVRLVDRQGGLSEAVDEAARRGRVPLGPGGLPELVVLPRPSSSPLETLRRLGGVQAEGPSVPELLLRQAGPVSRLLAPLLLGDGQGVEARMPYDLELR